MVLGKRERKVKQIGMPNLNRGSAETQTLKRKNIFLNMNAGKRR